jgi:hypothetical protein
MDETPVPVRLYELLIPNMLCLIAFEMFMRGLYALLRRFGSFSLFVALLSGSTVHAQTSAVASHSEVEDLRQTVRELAQRVNALEQELHEQRTSAGTQSVASVRSAVFVPAALDIRSSVESLSSNSAAAEIAPAPVAGRRL